MKYKLKDPFQFDGKTIMHATFDKKVKVSDRIKATTTARELFGEEEGDSVLLCVMANKATFHTDDDQTLRINAQELGELLSYEDFSSLYIGDSFLGGEDQISKR
jgi:hypothetical protein